MHGLLDSWIFSGRSASNSPQQVLPWLCLKSRRILPAWRTDPQRECSVTFLSRENLSTFQLRLFHDSKGCLGDMKDGLLGCVLLLSDNIIKQEFGLQGLQEGDVSLSNIVSCLAWREKVSHLFIPFAVSVDDSDKLVMLGEGKHVELGVLASLKEGFSISSQVCW